MRRVPWVTEPELCKLLFACGQYITFHSPSQPGFANVTVTKLVGEIGKRAHDALRHGYFAVL